MVSKVAARRDDFGAVLPYDNPDQLRAGIEDNLATLGVEQLTAVNLRVMDNAVPDARFVDQLGALMTARDEGLIGGIGISNVSSRPPDAGVGGRRNRLRAEFLQSRGSTYSMPILDECSAEDRVRAVLSLGLSRERNARRS